MHRLLLLTLATAACVADSGDEAFVVLNNITPGEECTVMPTQGGAFTPRGTIYLGSPAPYTLTPLIESRITATATNTSQRTVALQGARVELAIEAVTVTNGDAVERIEFSDSEISALQADGSLRFTSLFSAPLEPGGQTAAQFDVVSVGALAAVRAKTAGKTGSVRAQFVATSTVFGLLGDDEVDGVPYVYPVTACTDCIVNVISEVCPAPNGTQVRVGNGCNPFQDGVVDCCLGPSGLVCPSPVATM